MNKHYFLGVDGGGTKSILRLEDENGELIGQMNGGPANLHTSLSQAKQSIETALHQLLERLKFSLENIQVHAGIGLAGCENVSAYLAYQQAPHPFKTLVVASDAHVACLGAHQGKAGSIISVGTGIVGYQIKNESEKRISGWGFPYDDHGSGACLGLEAVKLTLAAFDERVPASGLTRAVMAHFGGHESLLAWLYQANATAFATLAPVIIAQSQLGDKAAIALLQQAGAAIDLIAEALDPNLPCALLGGLGNFLQPYLKSSLKKKFQTSLATPEQGALMMIRARVQIC